MRSGWRSAAVFALCAAAVIAAACGGDSGSSATYTAIPPSSDPSGVVTPFPTPTLDGNVISSPSKGYTATLPDGWTVRANLIQTKDASIDAFFEPLAPGAKVQASITVNCIVRRALNPEDFRSSIKTNTIRQGLNHDIQQSERVVSGVNANVLTYWNETQQANADLNLDKQDLLFSNENCDWMITTTTLRGEHAKYEPQFNAFLDSFKLLP